MKPYHAYRQLLEQYFIYQYLLVKKMDSSKSKIEDEEFDFLPSKENEELKQTYHSSRQSVSRHSYDIGDRQSRLSDAFRGLEDLSQAFNVEVIKDQYDTLCAEKQMLEKELQDTRQETSQLRLTVVQLAQNDKQKSSLIQQLRAQNTNLLNQLTKLSEVLKQDKKQALITLENTLNQQIYGLQREIESYAIRRHQFEEDMNAIIGENLQIKIMTEKKKRQIDSLQLAINGLNDANLGLKVNIHELTICINAKKTLISAIQAELQPYRSVKEEQLAQQIRGLVQSFRRLTEESEKSAKAMVMIEKIIKQSRVKPDQVI